MSQRLPSGEQQQIWGELAAGPLDLGGKQGMRAGGPERVGREDIRGVGSQPVLQSIRQGWRGQ